jgi:hypothetical protein
VWFALPVGERLRCFPRGVELLDSHAVNTAVVETGNVDSGADRPETDEWPRPLASMTPAQREVLVALIRAKVWRSSSSATGLACTHPCLGTSSGMVVWRRRHNPLSQGIAEVVSPWHQPRPQAPHTAERFLYVRALDFF